MATSTFLNGDLLANMMHRFQYDAGMTHDRMILAKKYDPRSTGEQHHDQNNKPRPKRPGLADDIGVIY